jgi:hypothetical protein
MNKKSEHIPENQSTEDIDRSESLQDHLVPSFLIIKSHDEFLKHVAIGQNISGNNNIKICDIGYPNSNIIFKYKMGYDFLVYLEKEKIEVFNFSSCSFNYPFAVNENFYFSTESRSERRKTVFDYFKKVRLIFGLCEFKFGINLNNFSYNQKIRFWKCKFHRLHVYNATFNKLFELVESEVYSNAFFNKVEFNANCVFTKTRFHKNCIFTYSTFEKQGIFSRAIFRDKNNLPTGLDLSQSIVNGQLTFFETDLGNYEAKRIDSNSTEYDDAISDGLKIPIQNKRETFRIIKHQLLQQNNVIEAEKYDKLEKQTLLEEKDLEAIFEDNVLKTFKILFTDYFVLKLNKYSNNHKTSWLYALIFTLVVSFISHSILSISESNDFCDGLKFIKLLNPIDFSFYSDAHSGKIYTVYFVAKIFIGFGIYQLIQAFRKYR